MSVRLQTILLTIWLLAEGCVGLGGTAMARTADSSITDLLRKPGLKILHIGNSFTFDAVSYLSLILNGTGADVSDMCIYRTMRPGASFKEWYDIYNDCDSVVDYQIEKVCGGINADIETGTGAKRDGSLFRKALNDEPWDIIFVQPSSTYSPYYDQWTGYGAGGYLNALLALLKNLQPNAVIGMMLVHSSASFYEGNAEKSSLERWRLNVQSVDRFCSDYGVSLVVPYGTAVQNMRASSLNNDMDLTADGLHCEYVLTRYTASCCYYQSVLAPRTGISITTDKTRINKDLLTVDSSMISVDDDTAPLAQKAAVMAVEDWHSCKNPGAYEGSGDETASADVNGDGVTDVADIASVISVMAGESGIANPLQQSRADVNGDGMIDVADIATIISIMAGGGDI